MDDPGVFGGVQDIDVTDDDNTVAVISETGSGPLEREGQKG